VNIYTFIRKRPHLVWYVGDFSALDESVIVEAVLNYGNWKDVQELIRILGMKKVAEIFQIKSQPSEMQRVNYRPEVVNYFTLYFRKYAS